MHAVKQLLVIFSIGFFIWSCSSLPIKKSSSEKEAPVVIANDSLAYEIIIIDPGFNAYLNTTAYPKEYYSQTYLENKNAIFVTNWNIRARNPRRYNAMIYENSIDYELTIDYGYEVNYTLFNYFMFAQQKYNINLGTGYSGRIR
jgi:hypothetical protein